MAETARQHRLTVAEVEGWRDQFLRASENAFWRPPKDEEVPKDDQFKQRKQKIRDLVVEDNDVLREALKPYPLAREMFDT